MIDPVTLLLILVVVVGVPWTIISVTRAARRARPLDEQRRVETGTDPNGTNTLALMSLIFSIVGISIVGVILGHVALGQIRRTGERGRGMAYAGLTLGYFGLAAAVLTTIILIVVGISGLSIA